MAVSLSVKNVPDELAALLRRRAADNRRSLPREASANAAAGRAPRDAITVEELGEIARRLFPEGTESSVAYLRQMRDRR
jgi:plasmid stability protein